MSSQTVRDMGDIDCVQVLAVAILFDENLVVQVVQVFCHEDVNVSHDLQNVKSLFEGLCGQVIVSGAETKFEVE